MECFTSKHGQQTRAERNAKPKTTKRISNLSFTISSHQQPLSSSRQCRQQQLMTDVSVSTLHHTTTLLLLPDNQFEISWWQNFY